MTQASRGRRRGSCFTVRISDEERAALDLQCQRDRGPTALGPWLVWRALGGESPSAVPELAKRALCNQPKTAVPARAHRGRVILDLCGGSGEWSRPYRDAGYDVRLITLPHGDVRTFTITEEVWGILAAPPCTEFSIARNGWPLLARDFVEGMACVNACMRIVLQCQPRWWALENPAGHLGAFLGPPRDTFEPHHFGDPWTKRTCLWGSFNVPKRGPFVTPNGSAARRSNAAKRAITPPGFARAFFESNP